MMTQGLRAIRFAFQNFWRNFWLSLVTVSMLTLTLLSVNALLILDRTAQAAIRAVEDRIEVSVYLFPTVSEERVASATATLRALPQVRDVETVTADEALDRFKRRHAGEDAILKSLDEIDHNPFGPSLIIKARSTADFPLILDALQNPQFRDDIREKDFSNYADLISRVRETTDRARTFGLGVAMLFLFIAIMIVFNTVRIGIFIHREEIGIMKLVGATNPFVKAPFLIEAVLYSLLATLIAVGLVLPSVAALEPKLDLLFGSGQAVGLVAFFQANGFMIFGAEFLVLALLNVVATSLAMRKYLRV